MDDPERTLVFAQPLPAAVLALSCGLAFFFYACESFRRFDRTRRPIEYPSLRLLGVSALVGALAWMCAVGTELGVWVLGPALRASPPDPASVHGTIVVQLVAIGYFAYRVMAGSLFATTSVAVRLERVGAAGQIRLIADIERGDQWLADVSGAYYALIADPANPSERAWTPLPLPMTDSGTLRLSPREKISTVLEIDHPRAAYIDVSVVSYATLWPIPSETITRVRIGPRASSPP